MLGPTAMNGNSIGKAQLGPSVKKSILFGPRRGPQVFVLEEPPFGPRLIAKSSVLSSTAQKFAVNFRTWRLSLGVTLYRMIPDRNFHDNHIINYYH